MSENVFYNQLKQILGKNYLPNYDYEMDAVIQASNEDDWNDLNDEYPDENPKFINEKQKELLNKKGVSTESIYQNYLDYTKKHLNDKYNLPTDTLQNRHETSIKEKSNTINLSK